MDLEREIHETARRITAAGASERTRVYQLGFWSERLLDWAMSHPAFKTQLFRFVDVFPACRDDDDVMRHVEEYFGGVDVPRAMDWGLEAAEHIPFGARITASIARRNVLRMAKQFIAGNSPQDALPRIRELWRQGEATTVDLLGEKTVTLEEADRYAARFHELLDALARDAAQWPDDPHLERDPWGPVPRVNVSVKPTALAPLYGPLTREAGLEQAYARMRDICAHAREVGAALFCDMEHYDTKDLTLELVRRCGEEFPETPQLGAVIQAYLKDSYEDLRDLIAWSKAHLRTPLAVRLVKGAYWDVETIVAKAHGWHSPVWEHKAETDANFERCTELLLENAGDVRPAFGSHNIRSISRAMASARRRGLHDTAFEIQLLYGMAEPVHAALRKMGMRVRAYAPVGDMVPGMAYLVRRLLENTANESFLRHRFAENRDLEELIARPQTGALENTWREPVVAATDASEPSPFENEPDAEFRRAPVRERFQRAVDAAVAAPAFDAPLIVGGRAVSTSDHIDSVDPSNPARVVCRSARSATTDADRAVALAKAAQPRWAAAPAAHRSAVLFRAAAIMRARRDELAALEVVEAAKPWAQADADVCEAIDFCEYYGREALRLAAGSPLLQVPGESNRYHYHPRGIAAVIAPWNFPLAIPAGMVTAALVCGNAVLFKPAEQTPGIAFRLAQILLEAGVPPDVFAFLPGAGEEVGAHLVDHVDVALIAFTGSKAVGLQIIERAAITPAGQRHVKRVIVEMGGKNAIIVDSDADLDVAVPGIVDSAFGYAGQKCSAASRVIAVGAVYDDLIGRLRGAARLVPVGPPERMGSLVGPVIDEDAWKRVRRYQEIAREEGEVLLQRDDVPRDGWFVGPTVAAISSPQARVVREEIFGPLLAVTRAESFEHALALANDTEYALTAGIFSRLPSRIRRASEELRAGNVYVNRAITGAVVGRQPFGGYGLSGVGSKAGGPDYLLQFVEPRAVTENTIRQGFAPLEN